MLALAADAIFSKAKSNTGEVKVQKASLPTDNIITLMVVGSPILLITFALTFSPNLATEDGMRCSPTSEMANRFYIYNYCWENFVHYDIKKDNETNEFVQDGDPTSMMYHKAFPYAFFCAAFTLCLPTICWILIESEHVKRQATYMMSGLEEALTMTLTMMSDLVTNKAEWREKSEKTVKTRLQRQMREEEYSEEIELKFESFKKFLIRKGTSSKMMNTFFWRRFFTALIMVIDGFVIYKTYHDNNQDYFNCKLNWKAKNSFGTYGIDGSGSDFVLCSIGDVSTRILLVQIYLVILAGCFIASIVITCKEIYTAKHILIMLDMIPMIKKTDIVNAIEKDETKGVFGMSDLHLLLFLARENFTDHKLFQTCNQALTMANATTSPKPRRPSRSASVRSSGGSGTQLKNIEDMEKCDFDFNDKYFAFLETMVAWGIEDENDEIADNVVKNVNHNAEE